MKVYEATEQAFKNGYDKGYADAKAEEEYAHWKYYNKQNIAVCTNCSFERDLSVNFGKAIACPNCGAKIV